MKRIMFLIIFAGCTIIPAISNAQIDIKPAPVQNAKNGQKATVDSKSKVSAIPQDAAAQDNIKNEPVMVSDPVTIVSAHPSNRKFIDPANMDLSVKPGDNFYLYANGTWLKKTPISALQYSSIHAHYRARDS